MAVVRKLRATVGSVTDHGEHVYTVEMTPEAPLPRFQPGQFLHLALDPYEPGGFWPESRVFSIASSPTERERLSITYAVKGAFTTRMERELASGREVWVKLPYGEFVVDGSRDSVLFAGGTGITAFTAFLGSLAPAHDRHVLMLYGARTPELFVYRPLVEACAARVPVLAARLVCEATDGRLEAGMATSALDAMTDPLVYLAGPPAMLTSITGQLAGLGIPAGSVRTDAWE